MIEFRVSAPGKIILYGEHAVVYGKTAVAASLDLRTILDYKDLPDNSELIVLSMPKIRLLVNISLPQVYQYFYNDKCPSYDDHENYHRYIETFVAKIEHNNLQQKLALEAFFYLYIGICKTENIIIKPFQIVIETALAVSSGLGSSASFAVCIATCFLNLSKLQKQEKLNLNIHELDKISMYALNCEKIMHGTPSGIDNSICTYGSIIEFKKGEKLEPIIAAKGMRVLLVDTRVQRSTRALVENIARLKLKYPGIITPILESIDSVAKEALVVIKEIRNLPDQPNDSLDEAYKQLMILMNVNQGLLATCQVSHPSLDRICAEATNYGLAAKLTGAGGGGYAYVLLHPNTTTETITSITKKLIANGYLVTLTRLGGAGVQIHDT